MPTNKEVREAVKVLVIQYKKGLHKAGFDNCPLCIIFGAKASMTADKSCKQCPNYAFTDGMDWHPCVTRTDLYPALDWGIYPSDDDDDDVSISENQDNLIKFWKRVLTVLPTGYKKEFVLTENIKGSIISIAKQIQDDTTD